MSLRLFRVDGRVVSSRDRSTVLQSSTFGKLDIAHFAKKGHAVDVSVADEASAFARVARTSYELVGAPPTLVAAACVVAASPDARAVAEAASALDTPWGGSPSRIQSTAALLRAARAKRAGNYAPPPREVFVPVETPDDCATVTPDPPTRSPSPYSKH